VIESDRERQPKVPSGRRLLIGKQAQLPHHPHDVVDAVARSRALVTEALADGGLERLARRTWPDGRAPSLRRLMIDLIEEHARNVGHADLIRESVDGLVGEDPPG
jgi:hypothetical protein